MTPVSSYYDNMPSDFPTKPSEAAKPKGTELTALIRLAAPLLVGQLAIIGLSITDIILTGRAGTTELAGVTLGATLFDLPMMFLVGLFVANSTLVGRLHGAGEHSSIARLFHSSLGLAFAVGLVAILAVSILRLYASPLLGSNEAVLEVSRSYLLPMTGSAFLLPFVLAYRTTFEGMGQPVIAMVFNVGGFLLNIPLDYALIYGYWGLPALGGAGCGWATLIVLLVMLSGETLFVRRGALLRHLKLLDSLPAPRLHQIRILFALGMPIGAALLAEAGFFHVIPLVIARLGATAVAGHAVAMSFDLTMFMIPLAISQAITIRVANSLGSNNPSLARSVSVLGIKLGLTVAVIQSLATFLLSQTIPTLYSTDPSVIALAGSLLTVAAVVRIFDGVHICGTGVLRGYGDTRATFVISATAFWVVGFPLCLLLGYDHLDLPFLPGGAAGVWCGIAFAVAAASVLTVSRVRKIVMTIS